MVRRQREDDDENSYPQQSHRGDSANERPRRLNRGQGGATAQLAAVSEQICPTTSRLAKQSKTLVPATVASNAMAPAKRRRVGVNLPTRDDPPLSLDIPRPSHSQGTSASRFGFQAGVSGGLSDRTEDANDSSEGQDVGPRGYENGPETPIDEQSPDEDERIAQQFLRSNRGRNNVIRSDPVVPETDDEESHDVGVSQMDTAFSNVNNTSESEGLNHDNASGSRNVLQEHYRKNRPNKPPSSAHSRLGNNVAHANGPVANPQRNLNSQEQVPAVPASTSAQGQAEVGAEISNDASTTVARAARHSQPAEKAKPSQLRYYTGLWVEVLITAKNLYRLSLHTKVPPFPTRGRDTLNAAQDHILEAYEGLDENMKKELDMNVFARCRLGMMTLIFEDGSTYRGRMKNIGREVVKLHFDKMLNPSLGFDHHSGQLQTAIALSVTNFLETSGISRANEPDAKGHTQNFAHPAPMDLCKRFYYGHTQESLAFIFPRDFECLPKSCLVLACTCIVNCLHEWQSGAMVNVSFTAERYAPVYDSIMEQFNRTLAHPYHGIKVRRLLQRIANEAQSQSRIRAGHVEPFHFEVNLD